MQKIFKMIDKISDWAGIGASGCILIVFALILVEIFLRDLTGRSTFITEEYSGYLLSWFAFLGMSYTLKSDGHIRVNILLSRLGRSQKAILEIIACLVGGAGFLFLTIYLAALFYDSLTMGVKSMHVSKTALFIPQFMPVLGSAIMVLQFVSLLDKKVRDLSGKGEREELSHG